MKITSVEVMEVNNPNPEPTGRGNWRPIMVMINTHEGISGLGEVGVAYGTGASAGFGMVKDLAGLIIGMDPMKNEAIWEKMLKKTFWGQGGGTIVFGGMSGIDIALWDIKGKALGVPVYQLLGGKTRDRMRTYASQIQFGWEEKNKALVEPEAYAEAALKAVADGYDCVKVDPLCFDRKGNIFKWKLEGVLTHDQVKTGYDRLKAIREAVGADVDIILELHSATDTVSAIQFGKAVAELDLYFYEEPVMPLNPECMKKVSENVNIPLASGERIYSRWGYRPFLQNGSLAVIQPDLGTAGGFTEGKKICDMAHIYDVSVQMHVCGSPIATAVALQLEAVIPNFIIHELHRRALQRYNIAICKYDYKPSQGYYEVPELPGIGQELTEETIKNSIRVEIS